MLLFKLIQPIQQVLQHNFIIFSRQFSFPFEQKITAQIGHTVASPIAPQGNTQRQSGLGN